MGREYITDQRLMVKREVCQFHPSSSSWWVSRLAIPGGLPSGVARVHSPTAADCGRPSADCKNLSRSFVLRS